MTLIDTRPSEAAYSSESAAFAVSANSGQLLARISHTLSIRLPSWSWIRVWRIGVGDGHCEIGEIAERI
jgi:hypothetical protein